MIRESWRTLKSGSLRVMRTLVTTTGIVLAVVGKLEVAAAIGLTDTVLKIAVYVFHERAWNKIGYGREVPQPEYTI